MAKSVKTQLREIAEAAKISDKQKAFIIAQSEAMGVKFTPTNCGNCYQDQAVILWSKLVEDENAKDKNRRFLLRPGKDVTWNNIRVNATTSEADLEALLAQGFPRHFFSRIDGEDGNWLGL